MARYDIVTVAGTVACCIANRLLYASKTMFGNLAKPRRQWWLLKQRLNERARYSRALRSGLGHALWARARLARSPEERLRTLCAAYSRLECGVAQQSISAEIAPWIDGPQSCIWREKQIGRERHAAAIKAHGHGFVSRTVLVKAPGANGEKGVLITYFEYNFQRLLDGIKNYREFTDKYTVVYATSWSPTSYHLLANLAAETTGPVFVQPANYREAPRLNGFHPRIRCLDSLACDWVHPSFYDPKPFSERDIDILVVSNWAPFKRHWAFFAALRDLPASLKIVCVGQPASGRDLASMRALQELMGARQNIEFLESIPISQVEALQCRAKLSAIFSKREGGCVAATEALMAGAALVMVDGASIGSFSHINERTGFVLHDGRVAEGLLDALAHAHERSPRAYAMEQVSCEVTSAKLNNTLKQAAAAEGRPWTRDIATPVWHPYPCILDPDAKEALRPAFNELHQSYPAVFPDHLHDTSHC